MEIKNGVHFVGVLNPTLRCFDFIPTRYGTTYNSFLIQAAKPALVDGVLHRFVGLHLDKIRALIPPEKLSYLIVNHTEPDHASGIGAVLDAAPQVTVVGTQTALGFLKQILNRDFQGQAVDDGQTLDLGDRRLRFLRVPFWHWPDTMFSYLEQDRVLFSCDGFGSHYCDERMFDDQVGDFSAELYDYYNHIMRQFAPKIRDGLGKLKGLPIDIIAPSHGPILRTNPERYLALYDQWSAPAKETRKRIAVFYASIYGSTRRLAQAIAAGAMDKCEVEVIDAFELDSEVARTAIERSDGLIFGSVTLNGDAAAAMWQVLTVLKTVEIRGKQASTFGSYGWSGEATACIENRLKTLRIPVVESGLRFQFTPTGADLEKCREFGKAFADKLSA